MGDINLLGMIRNIKNSISGFVSTSDKATKSKFGIVKVGDNISVSSGTISVPVATEDTYGVVKAGASGGGFNVEEIFSDADPQETSISFTFPEGKSISDYTFLLLATNYTGASHTCVTSLIPVAQIIANTSVLTALWYDAQWNVSCNVTATGCNNITGQYKINKVYAF